MARVQDKQKALVLRKEGKSYSEIKVLLGVSKSTLSGWLSDFPLSPDRIKELRDHSPRRIESFRNTMRIKRESRLEIIYNKVKTDIGKISNREALIGGMFLYWGEGGKTLNSTVALSNTDPSMLKFYIHWLSLLGVSTKEIRVTLHIYADMESGETVSFWSKELGLPASSFTKPYIKKSNLTDLTYKNGFGHGTCMVRYYDQKLSDYIAMALKYLKNTYCEELKNML
jgi:hypothetical protein